MVTEKRAGQGPSVRMGLSPKVLTEKAIEDAKEMAAHWESLDVVTSIDWESPSMKATNELATFSYRISSLNKKEYQENWEKELGLDFAAFCTSLLASLVCFLGRWALASLQGLVRDAAKFISSNPDTYRKLIEDGALEQPHLFHDFLLLLPRDETGNAVGVAMADLIDYTLFPSNGKPRNLPDIRSFLLFGACLMEHAAIENNEQKCLYFPLRLWWLLSTIVPLRPVEFLVTPYDCIRSDSQGKWYVSLRRDCIKGPSRVKHYKIQEDFELVEYEVPKNVAGKLQEYISFANGQNAKPSPLGTLFFPELHYKGLGREQPEKITYYTYQNFSYALHHFQEEVLVKDYGYEVVQDCSLSVLGSKGKSIFQIRPGDTRHLALLNAARAGVQPQTLMEMVRHSSITQTYWYAANDDVLRACATTQAYMENRQRTELVPYVPVVGYYHVSENAPSMPMHGGRCYSPLLNNKTNPDAQHCMNSTGPNREFGWCPACPYYRHSTGGDQFDPKKFALDAQSDWEHLLKTIDYYRKNMLKEDSLIIAFEKARASINVLMELVMRDVKEAGERKSE